MSTDKKHKVVLVIDARYPTNDPRPIEYGEWLEKDNDYIIASETVDVEFPRLDAEVVVTQQLHALEDKVSEEQKRHANAMGMLTRMKQKLMALEHDS